MARKFTKTYAIAIGIIKIPFILTTKRHWYGAENLPEEGGFLAVANHITDYDSPTFMHFLVDNGIPARVLAKAELFKVPLLGKILKITGQIPVHRVKNKNSAMVMDAAKKALLNGDCIALFPEGTLTHDPNLWPMKPKTGAARLALETGVPVIPVAQWGAHKILDQNNRNFRPFPPKDVTVVAGKPVYLADLYGKHEDIEAVNIAAERIMREITTLLAEIRQETPPKEFFDPKTTGSLVKPKELRNGFIARFFRKVKKLFKRK